jgi:threonine dehydratase
MGLRATRPISVALEDVRSAQGRIAAEIIRTPLVLSEAASERAGTPVYLKLGNLQRTGAFRVRGALSKVTSLSPEERQRGLVCPSSGNHGLGSLTPPHVLERDALSCFPRIPTRTRSAC